MSGASERVAHDHLIGVNAECPNTGKPYPGWSWTERKPYDSCAACSPHHRMARGLAVSLHELAERRERIGETPQQYRARMGIGEEFEREVGRG
jgi:hypothetical protein